MERKVGEIFTCDGKTYQVVKGITCAGCCISHDHCFSIRESLGPCADDNRTDKTGVIFKEIKDMEIKNNQLTIDIPEGMEIDLEKSNLAKGIVKFKKKDITYDDILQECSTNFSGLRVRNHCIDKIIAISQLMSIADYFNGDWKPDWSNHNEAKYSIEYDHHRDKFIVDPTSYFTSYGCVYFKNRDSVESIINNPNFKWILNTIYKN